jgi:hypothetical protein
VNIAPIPNSTTAVSINNVNDSGAVPEPSALALLAGGLLAAGLRRRARR